MRPGLRMPAFADAKIGSEILAPDDSSLLISPQDVVAQYADLLTTGDGSAFADSFEPAAEDPFRTLLKGIAESQGALLAQERVEVPTRSPPCPAPTPRCRRCAPPTVAPSSWPPWTGPRSWRARRGRC